MPEPDGGRQIEVPGRMMRRSPSDLFELLHRGSGIQVVQGLVAFAPEFHNLGRQRSAYGGAPAIDGDRADFGRSGLELSETSDEQEEQRRRENGHRSNNIRQTTEHKTSVERSKIVFGINVGRDLCRGENVNP